jgi:multisubunit Na+/H+ antiporter MnhG subunit
MSATCQLRALSAEPAHMGEGGRLVRRARPARDRKRPTADPRAALRAARRSSARAAFAAVLLPCFSCVMSCAGMLLTYPAESTALFEEYVLCSPTPRIQSSCAYAATKPQSFGTLLLLLALLFVWAFVEVSRVIGFLAFLIRYMKIVNAFTGVVGVCILGVGIMLLGEVSSAAASTDPDRSAGISALVPEWAPGLLVFAGLVTLLLSLLALIGLSRKKDNVLYAHAILSVCVCIVFIAGAARCEHATPYDARAVLLGRVPRRALTRLTRCAPASGNRRMWTSSRTSLPRTSCRWRARPC